MTEAVPEEQSAGEGPEVGATEMIQKALQDVFNVRDVGLGAQIVGDWVVLAEVHTADEGSPRLRMLWSEGMPAWRVMGMASFVSADTMADMVLGNMVSGCDDDD